MYFAIFHLGAFHGYQTRMPLSRVASPIFLGRPNFLTLSEQQYFVWDTANQSTKWQARNLGAIAPWPPDHWLLMSTQMKYCWARKWDHFRTDSLMPVVFFNCWVMAFASTESLGYVRHKATSLVQRRGVRDPDFRARIRQDSAHFEQTGSDQDYGFIQVSRSRFSNFIFGIWRQHNHKKNFCKDLKDVM